MCIWQGHLMPLLSCTRPWKSCTYLAITRKSSTVGFVLWINGNNLIDDCYYDWVCSNPDWLTAGTRSLKMVVVETLSTVPTKLHPHFSYMSLKWWKRLCLFHSGIATTVLDIRDLWRVHEIITSSDWTQGVSQCRTVFWSTVRYSGNYTVSKK